MSDSAIFLECLFIFLLLAMPFSPSVLGSQTISVFSCFQSIVMTKIMRERLVGGPFILGMN